MRLLLSINRQLQTGSLRVNRGARWRGLTTGSMQQQDKRWGFLHGNTVRVGCSSGFWGDTSVSGASTLECFRLLKFYFTFTAPQLVHKGDIDYLVADYLSEITMSLLTGAKRKNPVSVIIQVFLT